MQDLKKRFSLFVIDTAMLIQKPPKGVVNNAHSSQLIRSSGSPGTNYRVAFGGKSEAYFINKLKIAEEALDESMYFPELLHLFNSDERHEIENLRKEANELLSIIVASVKTSAATCTS